MNSFRGRDLTVEYRDAMRSRPDEGICPTPSAPRSPSRNHVLRSSRSGSANDDSTDSNVSAEHSFEATVGVSGQGSWLVGKEWSAGMYVRDSNCSGASNGPEWGSFATDLAGNDKVEYNGTAFTLAVNYSFSYSWGSYRWPLPIEISIGLPKKLRLISTSVVFSSTGQNLTFSFSAGLATPSGSDVNVGSTVRSRTWRFNYLNPNRGWTLDPATGESPGSSTTNKKGRTEFDDRLRNIDRPKFGDPGRFGGDRRNSDPVTKPDPSSGPRNRTPSPTPRPGLPPHPSLPVPGKG